MSTRGFSGAGWAGASFASLAALLALQTQTPTVQQSNLTLIFFCNL